MENVSEALIMAGSVLLFVIALSIAIVFFGDVRVAADSALDYIDRETTYIQGDYYYKATGNTRQVGLETVIPTVMRVYNESYEIYFDFKDGTEDKPLYKKKISTLSDDTIDINYLNLHNRGKSDETTTSQELDEQKLKSDNVLQGGVEGKRLFFKALLYGTNSLDNVQKDEHDETERDRYSRYYSDKIIMPENSLKSLYSRLKGKKITETSGKFTVKAGNDAMDEDIRVITYTVE